MKRPWVSRPRTNKRMLLMVLLLLGGGAILNVAVAWGCCMGAYRDRQANIALRRAPNELELDWYRAHAPSGVHEPIRAWPTVVPGYEQICLIGSGPIVDFPDGSKRELTSQANWAEAGIPFLGLRGEWFSIPDVSTRGWQAEARGSLRWSWRFEALKTVFPRQAAYLPWHPIWPGFAINTIFYAAILGMPFFIRGPVRRFVRIRGHRCPACGFIIAPRTCANGLCSECGAALPHSYVANAESTNQPAST